MPSSATPTARQQAYLDYIAAYTHAHRRAPAEAEMQHHFGVTPPSVHTMILTLEKRGFIRRTPGQARSITLVPLNAPPTTGCLNAADWSTVQPALAALGQPALLALLNELYAASEAARDLINSRYRLTVSPTSEPTRR